MHVAYITVKGGPKRGGGGDSKRGFPWGRGRGRNWFNIVINGPPYWILKVCFQLLKYYFYVSVSFAGSVFSLAKLGRLFVSDDYVELFDGLCSFCVLRGCT